MCVFENLTFFNFEKVLETSGRQSKVTLSYVELFPAVPLFDTLCYLQM